MTARTYNSDRVLAYLAAHPEGQDDDQIGEALHIDRHQINAICRGLAEADAIRRGKPATGGKVLNQPAPQRGTEAPAVHNTFSPPPAIVPTPSVTIPSVTITGPLVWLSDSHAMQLFAYDGTANLTEDAVKAAVKHVLESDGWRTEVHFGHINGALGELLRRMNAPDARYGLALPAHRRFTGLVRLLPLWIRQRLDLWFFFVRPTVDGLEVGVFAPDARRSHL
jgi:hypothetical protein